MIELTLYTTHCPKCKVLEKKLAAKNVTYKICESIDTMKELGIKSAPVLAVDNELLQFSDAVKYLNNLED